MYLLLLEMNNKINYVIIVDPNLSIPIINSTYSDQSCRWVKKENENSWWKG